jgi:hypothetical protein
MWKILSQEDRDVYVERANQIRAKYIRKYPLASTKAQPTGRPISPSTSASPRGRRVDHVTSEETTSYISSATTPRSGKIRRRKSAVVLLDQFNHVASKVLPLTKETNYECMRTSYCDSLRHSFDDLDETHRLNPSHERPEVKPLEISRFNSISPPNNNLLISAPSLDEIHNHAYESDITEAMAFSTELEPSFLNTATNTTTTTTTNTITTSTTTSTTNVLGGNSDSFIVDIMFADEKEFASLPL